jgi:UDP-glucose 4-epimerase
MSVLVTGGAGYIGSHVVLELLEAGEQVTVLDDLSTGFRAAVPASAKFVKGDVGDERLVTRLIAENGVNAIIHLAGSANVPHSVRDPLTYYFNNTCKSRILVACAIRAKVNHLIFSSSAAVYGHSSEPVVAEEAELRPMSPYGSSKLMTEIMLRDAAAAFPMRYVALRYFNVAGADPKGRTGQSTPSATHLIKVAIQAALRQRPHLEVFGDDYATPDGTCMRDYIHVSDLARAHLSALGYLRTGGKSEVLNCGYGRGFSVLEVVDAVKRVSGSDFPVRFGPRRAGDPPTLVAKIDRIGAVLDWHPRHNDLHSIVGHALDWERRLVEHRPSVLPIHARRARADASAKVAAATIPAPRDMRRRRSATT